MSDNNPRNDNLRLILLAMLVGLVSAVAGIALWNLTQGSSQKQSATATLMVLPEPKVIADFDLLDGAGQPFTLENLKGKWSLLFFGFTHCPDVCPSALYDLNLISEVLDESRGDEASQHQVIFVSVDPERDTPEKLSQYVSYFNTDFVGVTGSPEQLRPLAMQLGIAYQIEEHEAGDERYDVYHTASVLLTDSEGRLYGVFPAPHSAEKMAADLAAAIE